ncbi:hypothetical protein WN51_08312 [Melipona quadrifasciata]|uniref:Uncharacterized protein n=1 Tax=Melipona quadrifasciata TaxID=166423 RepID=A0A0M9AB03_9HYME|nr:hypothetical protein WN51_08312 [Melipona quadrifasciata]
MYSPFHPYKRSSAYESIRKFDIVRTTEIRVSFFVGGNLGRKGEPVHCSRRIIRIRPRIPQTRVSNTRLAQAASGCAPSVDVLPIFDVKQQSVRNPARRWVVRTGLEKQKITFSKKQKLSESWKVASFR